MNRREEWYKIVFDEWLLSREGKGDWYVAAEFVDILYDEGIGQFGKMVSQLPQKYYRRPI